MYMDILNSSWFVSMLKKSGSSPQARLMSLFDILGDWLQAPNMRELVIGQQGIATAPSNELLDYLTAQARACGVQMPELLAQQLYFMARGALQEALMSDTAATIENAKEAASALIRAQSEKEPRTIPGFAIAASFLVVTGLCGGLLLYIWQGGPTQTLAESIGQASTMVARTEMANPANTADIYAAMEQMRKGVCQFPEALQLPWPEQKVYVELVVDGLIPTTLEEQALARTLIQKVRCNYTPMLMSNSVS
jgi:hypothetical protein